MKRIFSLALCCCFFLLSGCGQQAATSDAPTESETQNEAAAPSVTEIIANDDLSNLQLSDPALPVYDKYTVAERKAKGLPTALPELLPYKEGKVAYLTFDDGPDNKNTAAILDILQEEHVPATFFIPGHCAEANPDMVRRIYAEHHAIGNHSYSHDYAALYPEPAKYIAEMEKTDAIFQSIIGVRPLITRAPGGTATHFTKAYPAVLKANGYTEHDWNVSSADAAPNHPVAQDFIDNISSQIQNPAVASYPIILMYCSGGHEETVKALPEIIRILKANGYTFGVITPMTPSPW